LEIDNRLEIIKRFDLEQSDHYKEPIAIPEFYEGINRILLVGSSGSGKSTILNALGSVSKFSEYTTKPICNYFPSADLAQKYLKDAGLNSMPTWIRPLNEVSDGERFRAELAINMYYNRIVVIDEFTSVLDRETAKSICYTINKGVSKNKKLILATGHEDVIKWLDGFYIYNTDTNTFMRNQYEYEAPTLDIERVKYDTWHWFAKHHYLMGNINKSSHCYVTYVNNRMAGFIAVNNQLGRDTPNSKREHRLVVLPQYQGRGLGSLFSNTIAYLYHMQGYRYFSKTSNVLLGEYRQKHDLWKPTTTNLRQRVQNSPSGFDNWNVNTTRISYSHEFIGKNIDKFDDILATNNLHT